MGRVCKYITKGRPRVAQTSSKRVALDLGTVRFAPPRCPEDVEYAEVRDVSPFECGYLDRALGRLM